MTFAQRIARILELTKESRASLVKRTGISKTALNDFLAGRTDPSFVTVVALIKAFPDYNARGLLTGVKSKAVIEREKAKKEPPKVDPKVADFIVQKNKPLHKYKQAIVKAVSLNKSAIPFLLDRMQKGQINGWTGHEDCCCLFGTMAIQQGIRPFFLVPGWQDDDWTAEAWFYQIELGDTPSTNEFARLAYEWISEYQRSIT